MSLSLKHCTDKIDAAFNKPPSGTTSYIHSLKMIWQWSQDNYIDFKTFDYLISYVNSKRPLLSSMERELLGDELNGGFVRNLCFTVWQNCQHPTNEDGKVDWCNDTLPLVQRGVAHIRKMIRGT